MGWLGGEGRGRPGAAEHQRDLAEVVARPKPAQLLAVLARHHVRRDRRGVEAQDPAAPDGRRVLAEGVEERSVGARLELGIGGRGRLREQLGKAIDDRLLARCGRESRVALGDMCWFWPSSRCAGTTRRGRLRVYRPAMPGARARPAAQPQSRELTAAVSPGEPACATMGR